LFSGKGPKQWRHASDPYTIYVRSIANCLLHPWYVIFLDCIAQINYFGVIEIVVRVPTKFIMPPTRIQLDGKIAPNTANQVKQKRQGKKKTFEWTTCSIKGVAQFGQVAAFLGRPRGRTVCFSCNIAAD